MVISLVGMHVFAILRNVLVKFEHAELISISASKFNNLKKQAKQRFYDNINEHLDDLKTVNSKMYWKTIHMLLKNPIFKQRDYMGDFPVRWKYFFT
jgi:6-pyruvoyl-tetrahydropterin synthase